MGVDYFVARQCPVHIALTSQGFLQTMVRRRQLAIFKGTHAMVGGVLHEVDIPDALPITTTRDGVVIAAEVQTRDQAVDLERELAPWSVHCDDCPARATAQPFGCYGNIGYPIHAATERWLAARTSRMGVAAAISARILAEAGYAGAFCARLRARNGSIFESDSPQIVRWRLTDGGVVEVSSDLLFELAIHLLPAAPNLLPHAAVLLGLVPPEEASAAALGSWIQSPDTLPARLVAPAGDGDVQQSFVDYLAGIVAAARTGSLLVVDP